MRAIQAEDWMHRQLSAVMSEDEAKRKLQEVVSRREKQNRTDAEIVAQILRAIDLQSNAPSVAG